MKKKFHNRMAYLSSAVLALFTFMIFGSTGLPPVVAFVAAFAMFTMPKWSKAIPGYKMGILGTGAAIQEKTEAEKAADAIIDKVKEHLKASKFMTEEEAQKKYELLIKEYVEKNGVDKLPTVIKELSDLVAEVKAIKENGSQKTDNEPILKSVFKHINDQNLGEKVKQKTAGYLPGMTIKAAALMTIGTHIVPDTANGYSINVNNFVDPEIGSAPKPDNFILDLVTVETQKGTEKIYWSERNTEEGDAQFIGEGDLKPLVSAKYETKSADVKEVALRWKMSDRMVMHTNRVVADFKEHAGELIDQEIDTGVLQGDGTGNNLSGITEQASAFVAPSALANFYVNPNIYDVINAVATQVKLANFRPTVVCLNTVEKAKMQGLKDANDNYIVPPFVTPSGDVISGISVKFSNKMPDGKILLGDLKKFKVVFAEDVMYATGWENDDFSKNLTSAKLEAFLGTYIKAPHVPGIVYDDIATIQTAIGSI